MAAIVYRKVNVDGFNIFYREAGGADAPALLLLHGFPSAGLASPFPCGRARSAIADRWRRLPPTAGASNLARLCQVRVRPTYPFPPSGLLAFSTGLAGALG
jgi:hypothetical protein